MSRTLGGGDVGPVLTITCIPDSTFKSELDALITADTDIANAKLVSLTWANNYEVTSPADNARFDGIIRDYEKCKTSPYYYLTVELVHYEDQNSAHHTPRRILCLPDNSGTVALRDSAQIYGTDYQYVDDGGTGGWGAAIAVDTPSGWNDFIF